MDLGILGAIALLVLWAFAALVMQGPGWVHLFLTVGVFLLIYRIVARSTPGAPKEPPNVQPKGKRAKG
ncbi:MAG: hypothetical protein H0X64_06600 [Gemmatimonadaceae bacterium]|nr:hypothetical protein [Gemmatimonadaceae bacterium]